MILTVELVGLSKDLTLAARDAARALMSDVNAQADRLAHTELASDSRRRDTADVAAAIAKGWLRCDCRGAAHFASEASLRKVGAPCSVPHSLTEAALALVGMTECEVMGPAGGRHGVTVRSGNKAKGIKQVVGWHGLFTLPPREEPLAAAAVEEDVE